MSGDGLTLDKLRRAAALLGPHPGAFLGERLPPTKIQIVRDWPVHCVGHRIYPPHPAWFAWHLFCRRLRRALGLPRLVSPWSAFPMYREADPMAFNGVLYMSPAHHAALRRELGDAP